jgi:hypothetical protein
LPDDRNAKQAPRFVSPKKKEGDGKDSKTVCKPDKNPTGFLLKESRQETMILAKIFNKNIIKYFTK